MRIISLILLSSVCMFTAQAQTPDTLDYRSDYYFSRLAEHAQAPVTRHSVVMLGNSLTERGDWEEYFEGCALVNRGIGGDCVAGMLARIDPIATARPKALFLMAGVNDLVFSSVTPEALCERYELLLNRIRKASPRTKLYIQSLLPLNPSVGGEGSARLFAGQNIRIEAFNALLRKLARKQKIVYIDIWSAMAHNAEMPEEYTVDGIHLSQAGYRIWIEALKPHLK